MASLFIVPLIPVAPHAVAQAPNDPWWGLSDRTNPTQGWAVRVPIVVENRFDYAMSDAFVMAQLDFSQLLVDAGWTNQTLGAETRLRGFTLDVDSIRVVEYNRGFLAGPIHGADTPPTPHVFYPAPLEGGKFREFHPERNPSGTVMWQVPGELRPLEKRYFYVYANPLEYGKTEPAKFDLLEKSPLDAFLWGTRGTTYLGWMPKQEVAGQFLEVFAVSPGTTTVTVSTYDVGRFVEVPSSSTLKNPFTIQSGGTPQKVTIPAEKAFKIEADKPIMVWGRGAGVCCEQIGYVPGRSGSFADDAFDVRQSGSVLVTKASPGVVQIHNGGPTLTNANPIGIVQMSGAGWTTLTGSGKFTVSMDAVGKLPDEEPFAPHPVPAITGGPSGVGFFSFLKDANGYYRLCPEANTTLRVLDTDASKNLQIFPEGPPANTPAARLPKAEMCHEIPVQRGIEIGNRFEFYATKEERDPEPGSPVPFRVFVGTGNRANADETVNFSRPMIGHYGGLAGVDYYVHGRTGLFGHYDNTRITIFEEKIRSDGQTYVVNRTRALQRDEFYALDKASDGTGDFHIVSTKPIAAVSLEPAQYMQRDSAGTFNQELRNIPIPYSRYVPGRPTPANLTVGEAEFRGPLVELRSPETDGRQLFRSTGPGSPLAFRLDALNLGRWVAGESLSDTITVTCTTPAGWTIEGCAKEFTLGSGSSERLNVVVTPSVDDVNATRTILVEAKSKAGGMVATFKLIVYVEVRYGVGMWFDVEGGRKTIDPPIGLDPAGTYRYNILLKNTGSTTDTFVLAAEPARAGWEQALLLDDEPVQSVTLDGGQSVTLQFRVKAPNAETAPQNIVSITAQSQTSALAADVVNTATRIRPKVDLEFTLEPQTRLAEPNETVRFNLTTRNKGNDVFTVLFRQDSILPKGWNATLSVDEITLNPNPGNDPTLNYVLAVDVTPPEGARAGDLASVKLAAEIDTGGAGGRVAGDEVSAVVVVRRIYNLTPANVFDAEATPGEALDFVLPITNRGNGQVSLELLAGAVEARRQDAPAGGPAWGVTLLADDVTLAVDDTAELPLRIEVPEGTAPGAYNLTFTTRLSREALQNLSIPVNVRALARAEFIGADQVAITPGRPVTLAYQARNTGNVETSFDFSTLAPSGWNGTFAPARARLGVGESVDVRVALNASRDAPDASFDIDLVARAEGAEPVATPLAVDVRRPQLSLGAVSGNGALRPGELVLVSATIQNGGGIAAENVSIALTVDGRVVDKVLLARIPVGSSALATLSWVSTQRGGDVKVILDPDEEIALPSRDSTAADVQFGSRLGVPAPGLALLLASVAAIALALRAAPTRGARERPAAQEEREER